MIKNPSKPKVHRNSKKISAQGSKIPLKKQTQKQNLQRLDSSTKLHQTLTNTRKNQPRSSKKSQKNLYSKSASPINLNKMKGSKQSCKNDEKFIEKLFDQRQDQSIEKILSQKLVRKQQCSPLYNFNTNTINVANPQSHKVSEIVETQKLTIQSLNNQISEIKLYISNYIFKVFDLTVLCRKGVLQLLDEAERRQIKSQTDDVIQYTESLVRQLNIENKLKIHCESSFNKSINSKSIRIRCHTESLKIPVQNYIEEFKKSESEESQSNKETKIKEQNKSTQSLSQMLEFLTKKNSATKGEDGQIIMIVKKDYHPTKIHELCLKTGQKVTILKAISIDRLMGIKDGKVGYFPKAVLE